MAEKESKAKKGQDFPWIDLAPKEIEALIVSLANEGKTASEIGVVLRDMHGIPKLKAVLQKTVTDVLHEHKLDGEIPQDLLNLIRRSVVLAKHMAGNKKDFTAQHGYTLTVAKIRRLASYYVSKKRLPAGWRFTAETAELLVK